jgi:hypothetical protein
VTHNNVRLKGVIHLRNFISNHRTLARIATTVGVAASAIVVPVGIASASGGASTILDPEAASLGTDLLAVAGAGAAAGIVIVGVRKGWRLLQRFF